MKPADANQLTAHIDFLPTLAEIAGVPLDVKTAAQIEGRSLVPLLENSAASWPSRTLFTHLGRWAKDSSPETGKYVNCSVRTKEFHLVSISKQNKPEWMLFDLKNDFGEANDVSAQNGAVFEEMKAAYEKWWPSVVPTMVNETAPLAVENPFWTLYRSQFGSLPPAESAGSQKRRSQDDK